MKWHLLLATFFTSFSPLAIYQESSITPSRHHGDLPASLGPSNYRLRNGPK